MIPAEVTPRIIPGVVAMQAGAWYDPDKNGVDRGGCPNVLTSQRKTPLAKGNAHQTMLVEVAKA
jgi:anaerobic dimethyl sulfoxide reductase subunit A